MAEDDTTATTAKSDVGTDGSGNGGTMTESAVAMKKFMTETKADGNKSVWAMTLETFGMADGGKSKKDDLFCATLEEAMDGIKGKVAVNSTKEDKWKFPVTPLKELDATEEDLLRAFVMWAHKETTGYNVSKAYRRLESYVDWMDQHKDVLKEPMTVESMRPAADAWKFSMTVDKKGECLCWWFDLGAIDRNVVKKELPLDDSLRFMVWMSHIVVFNENAQKNGMIMMEDLNKIGMVEMFTFMPADLSAKLDRLTIGILPIRMTGIYIFGAGTWMHVLMGIMKPFMGKKLRQRIITVKKKENPTEVMDKVVGKSCIPKGFAGQEGVVEQDMLKEKYFH